ncbi:VPS10 domain-containing protein [Flavobacterium sp.]|uniref:T9SS type A sorting domain-containing protein n=1 Tax=Flavobacterium sp. TaxID=239 RepID=UPI0039E577F4
MKKLLLYFILVVSTTLNAQDFWTESVPFNPLSGYYVNSISIVDENAVWVTGTNYDETGNGPSTWGISIDGGQTWTTGYLPVSEDLQVCNIAAVSATTAYVLFYPNTSTVQGGIWVTFDSGATWTQQQPAIYSNGTESFPGAIHMFDQNTGVVIGDAAGGYFEIYMTSNAGTNWIRVPSSNIPQPLDGEYVNVGQFTAVGNTLWFGTNKDRLFRSDNYGYTWVVSQMPENQPALYFDSIGAITPFAFQNHNDGILTLKDGSLYSTSDSGLTWTEMTTANGVAWNRSTYRVPQTTNTYFSLGRNFDGEQERGSAYSTDGGNNWNSLNEIDHVVFPVIAKFYSPSVGYCSGYNGSDYRRFFRLTDEMSRLLKKESFLAEKVFHAMPNPSKDIIKLSGSDIDQVAIFDLGGKQILVQDYHNQREITVDVSTWQNGLYLAKITSSDGTTASVKIIKE